MGLEVNMGNIISDVIGLLSSILTIITFFRDYIIGLVPVLYYVVYNNSFLPFVIFMIFLSCILFFLRGISIDVNYVLEDGPNGLDLSMERIRGPSGDSMRLAIQKENECTKYDKLLSFFKCKLLLIIEFPRGIKITSEGLSSEFTKLNPRPSELTLVGDLSLLSGRREIELYVEAEQDTTYRGNSPIFVKVYIGWQTYFIRNLLFNITNSHGFSKINILSDV